MNNEELQAENAQLETLVEAVVESASAEDNLQAAV